MDHLQNLIGEDPAFLDVVEQASRLAPIDRPCLVVGERGTGKEIFTSRLHYLSKRWDGPLVKINCAALSQSLLESELFGHEAGAFTGAQKRHVGCFERANGGTLVLDEIASASAAVQEKVLRVIEYGEFERLGGSQTLTVDVRVVGAANVDLPEMAQKGEFRADLLDRLAFDVLTLPPLRARRLDILPLAQHFALSISRDLSRDVFPGFSEDAQNALLAHDWPGNVRELRNVVERTVALNPVTDLPLPLVSVDPFESPWRIGKVEKVRKEDVPLEDFDGAVRSFERSLLEKALQACRYSQTETAQMLNLSYHQLRRLLKKHNVETKKIKEAKVS